MAGAPQTSIAERTKEEEILKQLKSNGISFSEKKINWLRVDRQSACDIRFAVVRRPLHQALVHEAPATMLRIDLHQHIGVRVVARRRHDVMLRTVVPMVVHPLMLMTRDHKLNRVLVFAQKRMQTVVSEFS